MGITISDFCSQVDISANRLVNIRNDQNIQDETIAITVKNASGIDICDRLHPNCWWRSCDWYLYPAIRNGPCGFQ